MIVLPTQYGCEEERICLMPKHEMVCDGQDEPVTSMPTKADREEEKKKEEQDSLKPGSMTKSNSDPVMDAPSC